MQPLTTPPNNSAAERIDFARARRAGRVPDVDIAAAEQTHLEALQGRFNAEGQEIARDIGERRQEVNNAITRIENLTPYEFANRQLAALRNNQEQLDERRGEVVKGIAEAQEKLLAQNEKKKSLMAHMKELEEALKRQRGNPLADKITHEGQKFCEAQIRGNK